MATQERTFEADGKTYAIRFTQNALFRLGKELGSLAALNRLGANEVHVMLWAGLEGARLKSGSRSNPFTLDEAGDIIDDAGGVREVMAVVVEAWKDAFPPEHPETKAETHPRKPNPTKA